MIKKLFWVGMFSLLLAAAQISCKSSLLKNLNETGFEGTHDMIIRNNELWAATIDGVERLNLITGENRRYTSNDGLADNAVLTEVQDNLGNLWFGTANGISCFDGKQWKTYTKKDGLSEDVFSTSAKDKKGNLWFGVNIHSRDGIDAYPAGVSMYDGKDWKIISTKDGLPSNDVSIIFVDNQGNIWFVTGEGLSRFDGKELYTFSEKDGLAMAITSGGHRYFGASMIGQDHQGTIWIDTSSGLLAYYDDAFHPIIPDPTSKFRYFDGFLEDSGGLDWFTFDNGYIDQYDGSSWHCISDFKVGNAAVYARQRKLIQDVQGNIYLCGDEGIWTYNGFSWSRLRVNN
jgi:ligand-binding sensor domain-containing protein